MVFGEFTRGGRGGGRGARGEAFRGMEPSNFFSEMGSNQQPAQGERHPRTHPFNTSMRPPGERPRYASDQYSADSQRLRSQHHFGMGHDYTGGDVGQRYSRAPPLYEQRNGGGRGGGGRGGYANAMRMQQLNDGEARYRQAFDEMLAAGKAEGLFLESKPYGRCGGQHRGPREGHAPWQAQQTRGGSQGGHGGFNTSSTPAQLAQRKASNSNAEWIRLQRRVSESADDGPPEEEPTPEPYQPAKSSSTSETEVPNGIVPDVQKKPKSPHMTPIATQEDKPQPQTPTRVPAEEGTSKAEEEESADDDKEESAVKKEDKEVPPSSAAKKLRAEKSNAVVTPKTTPKATPKADATPKDTPKATPKELPKQPAVAEVPSAECSASTSTEKKAQAGRKKDARAKKREKADESAQHEEGRAHVGEKEVLPSGTNAAVMASMLPFCGQADVDKLSSLAGTMASSFRATADNLCATVDNLRALAESFDEFSAFIKAK